MQPQYLATHASCKHRVDATATQIGGFRPRAYLFSPQAGNLHAGCPQATCTSYPTRGQTLARASGSKLRRMRCQRALRQWQQWALWSLSRPVHVTNQHKKNLLLWIRNPYPKNQHTQVNSSKPVTGRAFYAPDPILPQMSGVGS